MKGSWTKFYGRMVLGCAVVLFGVTAIIGGTTLSQGVEVSIGELAPQAPFAQVAGGYLHSLAVTTTGELWAWGYNDRGQIGDGTTTTVTTGPKRIGTATNWASVSATAGDSSSVALTTTGELWAWGSNYVGQLGDGTTTNITTGPKRIGTATNWASVSVGSSHSLAVTTTGELWAWGSNYGGRIGDGTTTDVTTGPKRIGTATNWASVSAGGGQSLAVTTTGELWAWGYNANGQVGDGTTTNVTTGPKRIGTATNWASVYAGGAHSLAVTTTGELWAWGNNSSGQIGDGTKTNTVSEFPKSPKRIGTATNWASVSGGGNNSFALTTTGELWAWGYNNRGQVGDGTTTDVTVPNLVNAIKPVSFAGGYFHSLAVTATGELWAWGGNGHGQVGDGTAIDRVVPTLIYGSSIPDTITITFESNEGSGVEPIEVLSDVGSLASFKPTDPERSKYTFAGWYKNSELTEPFDFESEPVPSTDITLWASWAKIKYQMNFNAAGGNAISPITHEWGEYIPSEKTPSNPTKEYSAFKGWFKDAGLTQPWDFVTMTMPESDITLFAKWEEECITITFVTNTVEDSISPEVVYPWTDMSTVVKRSPVRKGHAFGGWFKEAELVNIFDFTAENVPDSDITLYAGWDVKSYTVVYNFNGGTHANSTGTVVWGDTYSLAVPKLDNHHFQGWFTADGRPLTNTAGKSDSYVWDIDIDNYDVYAHWEAAKYTMRFDYDDGRPWTTVTHTYGELIPQSMIPQKPVREFGIFEGWFTPEGVKFDFETMTMPANGISLTVRWSADMTKLQKLVSELQGYVDFDGFDTASYNKFLDAMSDATTVVVSSDPQTIERVKKSHDDLLSAAIALTVADWTGKVTPPEEFQLPNTQNPLIYVVAGISAVVFLAVVLWFVTRKRRTVD